MSQAGLVSLSWAGQVNVITGPECAKNVANILPLRYWDLGWPGCHVMEKLF